MASIRFLCQHCCQPLKLNQRQERLGPVQEEPWGAQDGSGPSTEKAVAKNLQVEGSRRPLPDSAREPKESASGSIESASESKEGARETKESASKTFSASGSNESVNIFTLLGKMIPLKSLSSIQDTIVNMFDILSGQREVDHPLCEECTDNLLAELDAQIACAEHHIKNYRRGLESLQEMEPEEALRAELQELELEEARLAGVLEIMDQEETRLAAELRAAQEEKEELDRQERQYWKEYCALKGQQLELTDELRSVENQLWYAKQQQERLKKTSIFNATFAIWEEGPLGVINNFRLGCLPEVRVGWNEISCAWGQVTLLLLALSKTVGLQFQRYQPVPCGNRSYLKSLSTSLPVLPLFSDGKQNIFFNNKLDLGMVAFLDCLQQFVEEAGKGEQGLCLPHRIYAQEGLLVEDGNIDQRYSIRTHLNSENEWTKALKLMLVNLKWSLSWASIRYCQN